MGTSSRNVKIESMIKFTRQAMLLAIASSMLTSCYVTKTGVYDWDDSNANLIEQSIPSDLVTQLMDSLLVESDRLVVLSEESPKSLDNNLTVGIETQLIQGLVQHGVSVLERDEDMLLRLIGESSSKYTHVTKNKSSYTGVAASGSSGGSRLVGQQLAGSSYSSSSAGAMTSGVENWARAEPTELPTATKLLTYRVLECGIQRGLQSREGGFDEDKLISREAMTVLDIKLVDASTGQITFADRISGVARSEARKGEFDRRKDPSYRFYSHGSPLQNGNPEEQEVVKDDDLGISDAPNLRFLQGLVGLGAVGTFLFFALGG